METRPTPKAAIASPIDDIPRFIVGWEELSPEDDLPDGGADRSRLPEEAILDLVADVAAFGRGAISWDAAMNMPLPALREASKRLGKRWKKMTI